MASESFSSGILEYLETMNLKGDIWHQTKFKDINNFLRSTCFSDVIKVGIFIKSSITDWIILLTMGSKLLLEIIKSLWE